MGNQRLSYTYCVWDKEGFFYIGSRLCPQGVSPGLDLYLGSFTCSNFFPTHKRIISIFDDHALARDLETLLLYDLIGDKRCRNKAVFPLTGKAKLYPAKDPKIRKKLSEIRKTTPLSFSQLSHINDLNSLQKKENHPRADKEKRAFINVETQELLYGTIFDLERKGLSLHEARAAKRRKVNEGLCDRCNPWVLAECSLFGKKISYDRRYKFISVADGEQLCCSLRELSKKVNKPSSLVVEVLFGKVRYGWKLNDYPEKE